MIESLLAVCIIRPSFSFVIMYVQLIGLVYFADSRMKEEDIEVAIKVLVVGNGAVGKSSMIQRYCKGFFTKEYKKTIGVDFLEKQIK